MTKLYPIKARELGFIIDSHVYPWFAYKGPRFAPVEYALCFTDDEVEFLKKIAKLEAELDELQRIYIRQTTN